MATGIADQRPTVRGLPVGVSDQIDQALQGAVGVKLLLCQRRAETLFRLFR